MHDADKKGLKYLLEMKNERSKPFPMAKANAFFSRYKRLMIVELQIRDPGGAVKLFFKALTGNEDLFERR